MASHLNDLDQKRKKNSLPAAPLQAQNPAPLANQTIQRAQIDPGKLSPADVMALQRSVGNAAVANMLSSGQSHAPATSGSTGVVQRKLEVGPVDDRYEREADKIAQSMSGSSTTAASKSQSHTSASVQRDPVGPEGGQLQGDVESRLRQTQNSGSSLPQGVRSALEPKLGADLAPVKVHTDKQAVQLTQEMGAKAFTHKNHIYYGEGHSPSDLKLTAHETVHTIQQGAISQGAQRLPEEEKG